MASLSPLFNMSPATSDILGPNFFSPVYFSLIFHNILLYPLYSRHFVGPVGMLEGTYEQRWNLFFISFVQHSPATSDILGPNFFSPVYFSLIFHNMYPFSRQLDQYGC